MSFVNTKNMDPPWVKNPATPLAIAADRMHVILCRYLRRTSQCNHKFENAEIIHLSEIKLTMTVDEGHMVTVEKGFNFNSIANGRQIDSSLLTARPL